jgi:hypothetical protein
MNSEETWTQFTLDPTSMNLREGVHVNDPIDPELFKLSRDISYSINKRRMKLFEDMQQSETTNQIQYC